jgi:cyanophycin synthetase
MRLQDSRRLTGPNLHLAAPGAIAEVTFDLGEDRDAALAPGARRHPRPHALGWPVDLLATTTTHGHSGADLVFAAPVDALYLATEINDWAVAAANHRPRPATWTTSSLPEWRAEYAREHEPARAALMPPPPPPATSRSCATTTASRSATAAAPSPGRKTMLPEDIPGPRSAASPSP